MLGLCWWPSIWWPHDRRQGKICWTKHLCFQPHWSFWEIVSHCLGHKCLWFSMIKERRLNIFTRETCGTLENHEKCKSLAQQIFPRLWYTTNRRLIVSIWLLNDIDTYMLIKHIIDTYMLIKHIIDTYMLIKHVIDNSISLIHAHRGGLLAAFWSCFFYRFQAIKDMWLLFTLQVWQHARTIQTGTNLQYSGTGE